MTSDPLVRYLTQRTAKMDRRNRLRVMGGNEIVDVAIRVYQVLGWTMLKLTVVPSLFCLAAVAFFTHYVFPSYFVTAHPGSEGAQLIEMVSTTGLALFVAAPLLILGISYSSVVVTVMVSDYMLGNAPSPAAADERGRSLLTRLFWLNLREVLIASAGVLISLGLMAAAAHLSSITSESDATAAFVLILAWIAFAGGVVWFLVIVTRHSLAPAVLTLENASSGEAAKRSALLLKTYGVHGSGGATVWGMYVLLGVLWLLVWGGLAGSLSIIGYPDNVQAWLGGVPFAPLWIEAVGLLPAFLVIWTLTPIWASAMTIIYYDRRIRLEGYDIEALAEDVWRADRSRRFEL